MVWSAFVIGLIGSVHCIGMCGPIAMVIPTVPGQRFLSALAYLIGKTLTYALIGLFFGLLGSVFRLTGFQSVLSVTIGIVVLLVIAFPKIKGLVPRIDRFNDLVRGQMVKFFQNRTFISIFGIGLLNGFLPCGLIYIAVAGALETGFVELAVVYMVVFGLGTGVALVTVMYTKSFFTFSHDRLRKLVPYVTVLMGLLFITRGILYGLPPEQQETELVSMLQTITFCHAR